MKIRTGFVSNSSSSSFVVISPRNKKQDFYFPDYKGKDLVVDSSLGNCEFGWEPQRYNDFGDKLIFAYLQTTYVSETNWLELLEKVVKEKTGCENIIWNVVDQWNPPDGKSWGYIDHQSASSEGENTEIFDSEEDLINFLFDWNSFVMTDNDNH